MAFDKMDGQRRRLLRVLAVGVPASLLGTGCLSSGTAPDATAVPVSGTTSATAPSPITTSNNSQSNTPSAPAPSGATATGDSGSPFVIVRTGLRYATLASALAAAISGDTIRVAWREQPYVIDLVGGRAVGNDPRGEILQQSLTIEWETPGRAPTFDLRPLTRAAGVSYGLFLMGASCTQLTVRGIRALTVPYPYTGSSGGNAFVNVTSGWPYSGQSSTPYTLTVEYCGAYGFSNAFFSGPNYNGVVNLRYCVIEDCGSSDGLSHGSYMSTINTLNVLGCTFRTTVGGPQNNEMSGALLKTRARFNNLTASVFVANERVNRCLELDNGGVAVVRGCYFYRPTWVGNANQVIRFGAAQRERNDNWANDGRVHSLTFQQNTVVNADTQGNSHTLQVDVPVDANGQPMPVGLAVRGNIVAGVRSEVMLALGSTLSDNVRVQVGDVDQSSGRLLVGNLGGVASDADLQYVGDFASPRSRADANMGAFGPT